MEAIKHVFDLSKESHLNVIKTTNCKEFNEN